ncbi:MAG: YbjQ family protein [Syntrophomonadaceae bacterium]|jgi:uncharacterized protein YbjQ (UPF0145 family)|nr:YbjQ family protein [Syntrophomonadaceae bacterium]
MIITTTQTIENRSIQEYLGLVAGESIMEAHAAKEILNGIANNKDEASEIYKSKMTQARLSAIAEMIAKAEKMGADAIVAIGFNYQVIHDEMLMFATSGTAVKLAESALSM